MLRKKGEWLTKREEERTSGEKARTCRPIEFSRNLFSPKTRRWGPGLHSLGG
jgi:hypothetical protein